MSYAAGQPRAGVNAAYRDLKVHYLICERAHFVIEAESIFSRLFCRENRVHLPLKSVAHDLLLIGSSDFIINVEAASRLDLECPQTSDAK